MTYKKKKFAIIITAENKEKFITDTINSCIQKSKFHYEIILTYTKLKNINLLKQKYKKNVKFVCIKKKFKNPIQDQMFKIKQALFYTNSDFIFLCDGDDIFHKDKVNIINNMITLKKKLIMHDHFIKVGKKVKYIEAKKYKQYVLFKTLFNKWPDKIATSTICISKFLLINFFKKNSIFKYKYLAIDVQLVIFYLKKIECVSRRLVVKKDNENSVDKQFSKIFMSKYLGRRFEQHNFYNKSIEKKITIEYLILKLLNKIKLIK